MDSNPWLKKWLAIGILVMLMGIAIFPSLTAHMQNDNFITVKIKTYDTFDSKSYNVSLSMQEYEHLEELLHNIEFKLKNCTSIDETKSIFKASIVEFHKLGLLGDRSVEKAQMLVTEEHNKPVETYAEKLNYPNIMREGLNFICLTAGRSNESFMIAPVNTILAAFFILVGAVFLWWSYLGSLFCGLLCLLSLQIPAGGLGVILNGKSLETDHGYFTEPSHGWTFSIGLNGVRYHNGTFQGDLYDFVDGQENSATIIHCSALGFSGVTIQTLKEMFHIGGAALYKTKSIEI